MENEGQILKSKVCKSCGLELCLSAFSKSKLGSLGVRPSCKPCRAAEVRGKRNADIERTRFLARKYAKTRKATQMDAVREKLKSAKRRASLHDRYIKCLLTRGKAGTGVVIFPKALIEAKREHIKIVRYLRSMK